MLENISNSFNKIIPLNEERNECPSSEKSYDSLEQTSSSFKNSKNYEKEENSDFKELVIQKPIPFYYCPFFENNNSNKNINLNKTYFDYIQILINKEENEVNNATLLGSKRKLENQELLLKKNKNLKNENNKKINRSAFKKVELKNNNKNKSAFKSTIPFLKIKSINKNKILKKLENKIIINEIENKINTKENTNNANSINNSNTNEKVIKKNIFKSVNIEKLNESGKKDENNLEKKRRGRKPKNETFPKRVHDAHDYDNILRKIQVHFLTFIICFMNDLIEAFIPNSKDLKFKNLSYKLKKTVNHSYVEELKTKTVGDILQFQASSKNKRSIDSINKVIFQKVKDLCPFINYKFFNMSYLEIFSQYYYKSEKILFFEGKKVKMSERTRVFADLLEKNSEAAEKIQQIVFHNFMGLNKNDNKQHFFCINKKGTDL